MVSPALVEPDIQAGKKIVEALDHAGIPVRTALWLWDEPANIWRLVIASPLVDDAGPWEAYARVLKELPPDVKLDRAKLRLIGMKDPIRLLTKREYRTGQHDIERHYLSTGSPAIEPIEGALVYRST